MFFVVIEPFFCEGISKYTAHYHILLRFIVALRQSVVGKKTLIYATRWLYEAVECNGEIQIFTKLASLRYKKPTAENHSFY